MEWKRLSELNLSGNKHSQYGEEVVAQYIFSYIGINKRFLVDIGAGGAGKNLSNSRTFLNGGWKGLLFDMDGSGNNIIKEFIKPDNIVSLLRKHSCPKQFDFLSVDIDSFDFDVIDNVLAYFSPSLVCAEFNATLDPELCVKLKYEEGYTWDGSNKYGFSFSAGVKLFAKHGYTVVHNHKDTNLFAVRNDLLPEEMRNNVEVLGKKNVYHAINPEAIFVEA